MSQGGEPSDRPDGPLVLALVRRAVVAAVVARLDDHLRGGPVGFVAAVPPLVHVAFLKRERVVRPGCTADAPAALLATPAPRQRVVPRPLCGLHAHARPVLRLLLEILRLRLRQWLHQWLGQRLWSLVQLLRLVISVLRTVLVRHLHRRLPPLLVRMQGRCCRRGKLWLRAKLLPSLLRARLLVPVGSHVGCHMHVPALPGHVLCLREHTQRWT